MTRCTRTQTRRQPHITHASHPHHVYSVFPPIRPPPPPPPFPYTTLFRSDRSPRPRPGRSAAPRRAALCRARPRGAADRRSEEHTSELQSRFDLVCRLLLEKKSESVLARRSVDLACDALQMLFGRMTAIHL